MGWDGSGMGVIKGRWFCVGSGSLGRMGLSGQKSCGSGARETTLNEL